MGSLLIDSSARADFQQLYDTDKFAAAKIAEFIRQAKLTPALLDTFTQQGHGEAGADAHYVGMWQEQQRQGRNLWRVSLWEVDSTTRVAYRIIYAFDPPDRHIILGVAKHDGIPTDFYDDNAHPFTQRIIDIYDRKFRRR